MSAAANWISTDDLIEITGHTRATIEGWRSRGRKNPGPPFYTFGRRVRYKRTEVEAWIEACKCAHHGELQAA